MSMVRQRPSSSILPAVIRSLLLPLPLLLLLLLLLVRSGNVRIGEYFLLYRRNFCLYTRNENLSPSPPPHVSVWYMIAIYMQEILFKYENSCLMQETKISHQAPTPYKCLIHCNFLVENHAVNKRVSFDSKNFISFIWVALYDKRKFLAMPHPPYQSLSLVIVISH